MIISEFQAIDNLTSLGAGEAVLRTWNRYKAYAVLVATCRRLKEMFYVRFCMTKVVPEKKNFREMATLFKGPGVDVHSLCVEYVFFSFEVSNADD